MELRRVDECPWRMHASWTKKKKERKNAFMVKKHVYEHNCAGPAKNRQASAAEWIAKHFMEKLRQNHELNAVEMMRELDQKSVIRVMQQMDRFYTVLFVVNLPSILCSQFYRMFFM